jgi:hypothetical protein
MKDRVDKLRGRIVTLMVEAFSGQSTSLTIENTRKSNTLSHRTRDPKCSNFTVTGRKTIGLG